MDLKRLVTMLRATLDPVQHQQAEAELVQVHKIIGFGPTLLQIVRSQETLPVRQAASIYLKNLVTKSWQGSSDSLKFHIHEQDRALIRGAITKAIIEAPAIAKVHLCTCLRTIIAHDFPSKWSKIADEIGTCLQSTDSKFWEGALMCLYQLVKIYEYKGTIKRAPLIEVMRMLLPMTYRTMTVVLQNQSECSMTMTKCILKIFYALIKCWLPLELLPPGTFSQWMEVHRTALLQPVPLVTLGVDEEERPRLICWKIKKWALNTFYEINERYGHPAEANETYKQFSEFFVQAFAKDVLEALLNILEQYRRGAYVSPVILQQTFAYIELCIRRDQFTDVLMPHMVEIIKEVVFPVLTCSEADEDLFHMDPIEFVRTKYDDLEHNTMVLQAASSLLVASCNKDESILKYTITFCIIVLGETNEQMEPRKKEGALQMFGCLSHIMFQHPVLQGHIEGYLKHYVLPALSSPLGIVRARACWLVYRFGHLKFQNAELLWAVGAHSLDLFLHDSALPVKVEASLALQALLSKQPQLHNLVTPLIGKVTLKILEMLKQTEIEECLVAFRSIFNTFKHQLTPVSEQLCQHLCSLFNQALKNADFGDVRSMSAIVLLVQIRTLLDHIYAYDVTNVGSLQTPILGIMSTIFYQHFTDYFDEAFVIWQIMSAKHISDEVWDALEIINYCHRNFGCDYFPDMMPVLYNYVAVDSDTFSSNGHRVTLVYNICKAVLTAQIDEALQAQAAMLLETMTLLCKGKIDIYLPMFAEVVLRRLFIDIRSKGLHMAALQVLIALFHSNALVLLNTLSEPQKFAPNIHLTRHVMEQWLLHAHNFSGEHGRKVCVLGACGVLRLGGRLRPAATLHAPRLLRACLVWLERLKRPERPERPVRLERPEGAEPSAVSESEELHQPSALIDCIPVPSTSQPPLPDMLNVPDVSYTDVDVGNPFNTNILVNISVSDILVIFKDVITGLMKNEPTFFASLIDQMSSSQEQKLAVLLGLCGTNQYDGCPTELSDS